MSLARDQSWPSTSSSRSGGCTSAELHRGQRCDIKFGCIAGSNDATEATTKKHQRGQEPRLLVPRAEVFSTVGKPLTTSFDAGVPLRDVQEAASHADPWATMRYDCARV